MKVFLCNRAIDSEESEKALVDLLQAAQDSIAIISETEHSDNWKQRVEDSFKNVDFVLFMLGNDTFASDPMKWEYAKAKSMNKQIIGIKLPQADQESVLFCQGFPVFSTADKCWGYLKKTYSEDRQLLLEQYKIMVGSTEKVTEQRMRVNNLFFTVTSTILSASLVVGKTFEFSLFGALVMLGLSCLALVVTYLWKDLVLAYGKLNTGKFIVIDKIEKQLRTKMFEDEWEILKQQIGYISNTETEAKTVTRLRIFIIAVLVIESLYVLLSINYHPLIAWLRNLFQ